MLVRSNYTISRRVYIKPKGVVIEIKFNSYKNGEMEIDVCYNDVCICLDVENSKPKEYFDKLFTVIKPILCRNKIKFTPSLMTSLRAELNRAHYDASDMKGLMTLDYGKYGCQSIVTILNYERSIDINHVSLDTPLTKGEKNEI